MNGHDAPLELKGKNILVTGAAGFIGSHLVRELLRGNNRVTCLVRPGEGIAAIAGLDCRILVGDLLDPATLTAAVAGAETVFHLAAVMGGVSQEMLFRVNCQGTRNLVAACCRQEVPPQRFIFASSVTVMGPSGKGRDLDEGAPCRPLSDYGKSKMAAEEFLASADNALPYTIIRLPVVYGPGSEGGLYIFFKLLSKGVQVNVGTLEATVCFVWDVVQGMIAAAADPRTRGEVYILGEAQAYDLNQIYRTIAQILGRRPLTLRLPYFVLHALSFIMGIVSRLTRSIPVLTGEELTLYLKKKYWRYDTSKARRDFGFQSRYPFAEGARITIDWYRQHGRL